MPQAGVDFSIQLTLYIRPTIDSLDATFRFAQWGKITGDDLTRLIGKQTIINISPDTSELWVDFDFIGADSVIIEVFNDSLLVGTETVLTGFVGYITDVNATGSGIPKATGSGDPLKGLHVVGKPPCAHTISFTQPVDINGIIGTMIRLTSANPTREVESFTSLTIQVGNIDAGSFIILSESVDGVLTSIGSDRVVETPTDFTLDNNYPNPFNPITTIIYQIPELSFVTIKVYDVLGNEITTLVNEEKPAGTYNVEFNSKGLASGVYFYKLQSGNFAKTKKMVLMK